jgi:hypothetical protein
VIVIGSFVSHFTSTVGNDAILLHSNNSTRTLPMEKIDAMEKFGYLRETYNAKRRERFIPLPIDFIKGDRSMCGEMDEASLLARSCT